MCEEDDSEAKLSGKSLLREESNGEALIGGLLRGMLIANVTKGLEGSDEKGNVKVGRSYVRKTDEALVEIGYEYVVK